MHSLEGYERRRGMLKPLFRKGSEDPCLSVIFQRGGIILNSLDSFECYNKLLKVLFLFLAFFYAMRWSTLLFPEVPGCCVCIPGVCLLSLVSSPSFSLS